jgi:serine protease AprX
MKKTLILILFCVTFFGFSQSVKERQEIVNASNLDGLNSLKSRFYNDFIKKQERINKYLLENPNVKRRIIDGFSVKEISDVIGTEVIYKETSNEGMAITSRANKLYSGGGLGLNIQGQNMTAYVWDGGSARLSHNEFNNRVSAGDNGSVINHATHVTGTIVAQGNNPLLRGIAFQATAFSFDWNDDYTEMVDAATTGMLVSNHSYGIVASNAWRFGAYDVDSSDFDLIAFDAPFYLAVTAAGNDRNEYVNSVIGPYLSEKGGYNLTKNMQNAKNILTVGAVNELLSYDGAASVFMSDFSSWGPTDDGRIKPDIVTKGTNVRSTTSSSDTSNGVSQGTSMASPGVAGVALLLQQYYKSINPSFMKAATLKGLILHSADEAGSDKGPDYSYGWGLINAEKASVIIKKKSLLTSIIEENNLQNSQTYTKTVFSDGSSPLVVSISWTDRAGVANSGVIDPTSLDIVNDLDLRVIKNSTTYFPWTLNPVSPWNPAVRTSDNFRDNFEKVEIDTPVAGEYTIQISHKNGTLIGNSQNYSLIASGIDQNLSNSSFDSNDFSVSIFPNPANNILNFITNDQIKVSNLSIFDVSGKEVLNVNDLESNTVNVSALVSGIYFVKFNTLDKSIVKKFVKVF